MSFRKLFVHTGQHRPGSGPSICEDCDQGYHHRHWEQASWCECICDPALPVNSPPQPRQSFLERIFARATQFRDWAQREYVPRSGTQAGEVPPLRPVAPERAGPGHTQCPNCGTWGFDGTICGRCGFGYGYQYAHPVTVTAVIPPGQRQSGTLGDDSGIIRMAPRGRRHGTIWQPPQRPLEPWIQALLGAPTVADAMRDILAGSLRPALAAAV